jgi:hypothetical protein
MDDIAKSPNHRQSEVELGSRKLALSKSQRILLDLREHFVDGPPKLAA